MKYYSQLGQDKFVIEKIFNKKKDGFFVDVGAHDGGYLSNTATLEKEFDWSGICIEPSRAASFIIRQRKCKAVTGYCASEKKVSGQLVRFREFSPNELSVTIFEDLNEHPFWAKTLESGENYKDKLKKCKTLDEILAENSCPKNIDYVSIDTQGCEWLILKDFPFKEWNINVFTIANDMFHGGIKKENREKTKSLMEKNGYKLKFSFDIEHLNKDNWGKEFNNQTIEDLYIK